MDYYIKLGEYEDCPIAIVLDESSIGSRNMVGIKNVYEGIDWEHGKIIIQPDTNIVRKGRSKNDNRFMDIYINSDGKRFCFCPECNEKVSKNDNYCRNCGQKICYDKDVKLLNNWGD